MPTIKFNHSILQYMQSKYGIEYSSDEWEEKMPSIGCVVEENDDVGIEIEIFPDRTDLLSHETIARAARAFLNSAEYSPDFEVD